MTQPGNSRPQDSGIAPVLESVQVGLPKTRTDEDWPNEKQKTWTTGFYKNPVEGWVSVRETKIEGDGQADLVNHGGVDKAVLAYSADHFDDWQQELNIDPIAGGMFGENLTISGLIESSVCIGDQYQINDVVLEISQPRQPCWKLARRWGIAGLSKLVIKSARCGWYYRVLKTGSIKSGLPIRMVKRVHPTWTIQRAHRTIYDKQVDPELRRELASLDRLSDSWKEGLTRKLLRTQE